MSFGPLHASFLDEAKLLFPTFPTLKTFNHSRVTPVELAAAQIFDLHWAPATVPQDCLDEDQNDFFTSPVSCMAQLREAPLLTQRNLATLTPAQQNAITAAGELVKSLGLGSVNAYLAKLNEPLKPHPLSDNLLLDLRGSAAEYAFNFGILERVFALDARTSSVNETCLNVAHAPYAPTSPEAASLWRGVVEEFTVGFAAPRTLCKLMMEMNRPPLSHYENRYDFLEVRTKMFRATGPTVSTTTGANQIPNPAACL